MAKIEVGMMVQLIDHPTFNKNRHLIGKIGKVKNLGLGNAIYGGKLWIIEGISQTEYGFPEYHIRPISPPKTNQDIEETKAKGCGDWPFLKELLFNKEKENEDIPS